MRKSKLHKEKCSLSIPVQYFFKHIVDVQLVVTSSELLLKQDLTVAFITSMFL